MKSLFVRFVREDAGQDLIEYGLLIGIITVAPSRPSGPSAPKIISDVQHSLTNAPLVVVRRTRAG